MLPSSGGILAIGHSYAKVLGSEGLMNNMVVMQVDMGCTMMRNTLKMA